MKSESPGLTAGPETVEYGKSESVTRDELRAVRSLHDEFVNELALSLSIHLRTQLTVSLLSVEQLPWSEWVESLASPTCIAPVTLTQPEGSAVIELNPAVAFPILEALLGGNGSQSPNCQREVTPIEEVLLAGFFDIVLRNLEHAWKHLTPVSMSAGRIVTDARSLRAFQPSSIVVGIAVELRVGDAAGTLNIAVPASILKAARRHPDRRKPHRTAPEKSTRIRNLSLIGSARVECEVRCAGPALHLSELLDLTEGDVLGFDRSPEAELELTVNGKPGFRGAMVRSGTRAAFEIRRILEAAGR